MAQSQVNTTDSSDDDGSAVSIDQWRPLNRRADPQNGTHQHPSIVLHKRPPGFDPAAFTDCSSYATTVTKVLESKQDLFRVRFRDGHSAELTSDDLDQLEGGPEALDVFRNRDHTSDSEDSNMSISRPGAMRRQSHSFMDVDNALDFLSSSDDQVASTKGQGARKRNARDADLDSDDNLIKRPSTRSMRQSNPGHRIRLTRRTANRSLSPTQEASSDDDADLLRSDVFTTKTTQRHASRNSRSVRQSDRSTRHVGAMYERDMDDMLEAVQAQPAGPPKAKGATEVFKSLPSDNAFRIRHIQECETCGSDSNFAPLIYCQGCVLAYHKHCLGQRTARDHLVTKVGPDDFVLQCRRCIALPKKKDSTAPDQALCQDCHVPGRGCRPWRPRKTALQEQKEREENDGQDPIVDVDTEIVNNADNILFRCTRCFRAYHYEHLPTRNNGSSRQESSFNWLCTDCHDHPEKPSGLVAWRPVDPDTYDPSQMGYYIEEDDKAYLVKWEHKSYLRCSWMPGPWVWAVVAAMTRKAFYKKEESHLPKMRFEDAVPEDYLRPDIVLDVKYTSVVDAPIMEVDKARIKEVGEALIKYKGLGYEDAVWEKPPSPQDEERWTDFVTAYNYWVLGNYIHQPKSAALKARIEKARSLDFATKLEKKTQPANLNGGELMKYQLEGVNWLFYKWYTERNAILADEMGLGKTIQIIGLLATLVQDWNCFPFLIVVPNSTCANWRREIQKWAPSLRVVAYFGSRDARELAYRYELFPRGRKEMRCHIVVTSYDAAKDDSCRRFFISVPWQAIIVDEGQRLKNDSSLLYTALSTLNVPYKILLTGTPLQNNARELFNLLQFLDPKLDAAQLELDFATLDSAKIAELHEMIRPFFLRRTKAQVLTFLPPMAQVIVPVSMSTVTKKLYRSIIAKNPDLVRAIFADKKVRASDRGSLSNILMQLRKCLCHPFVYSRGIEDRNVSQAVSHRNLVEASGKLQLLELLLPKLKERGHRVLIFSQFLDMLNIMEDFLDDLGFKHARLDGNVGSLVKQKRIDEFNAPESELFVFLLSTRAGGVGINLATADTVIILDPDFNPHQDIQALSRAHRIGQTKKVSCYQLVTRASAEEKILQIGRKKMALDHVLVEQMDAEDAAEQDLESILRHGAEEIFADDGEKDVWYDAASVDKLLDRTDVEDTKSAGDKSAESLFSRARVWANNDLSNSLEQPDAADVAPNKNVWDKILHEREKIAAAEAAAAEINFGRGRRKKANVDYIVDEPQDPTDGNVPAIKGILKQRDNDNDTDFRSDDEESEDQDSDPEPDDQVDELAPASKLDSKTKNVQTFSRVKVQVPTTSDATQTRSATEELKMLVDPTVPVYDRISDVPRGLQVVIRCIVCQSAHEPGTCPMRVAGVEHCNLCGMAHFASKSTTRICPHMFSETQVRAMLAALKRSPEPREHVQQAIKYLINVKQNLVTKKKQELEKARAKAKAGAGPEGVGSGNGG